MVNCIQQFFFYPGVPPSHPPLSFSIAGASPSYTLDCLCFSMVLNNPVYNFSKNCRADIRMNNILVDTRVPLWLIIEMPFFFKIIYLFIYLFYLWLCWVLVSVRGLSLVAASGGHSSSRCAGLSLSRPLLLRSTGSRCAGSVIVAHGLSCSAACGILPDQGSNSRPLHWQADSQPLRHQGSPRDAFNMLLKPWYKTNLILFQFFFFLF